MLFFASNAKAAWYVCVNEDKTDGMSFGYNFSTYFPVTRVSLGDY